MRVLDLTRLYPGPLATMMLGDMGAEVLKIEDIARPDYMRNSPPFIESESIWYLAVNRSKKSVVLDLQNPQGVEIFLRLVEDSDIVVEQFRPGILDKAGYGYSAARSRNSRIIYVSLTGYGQSGPYAPYAGHDLNYIGYAGVLSTTATRDSAPAVPGVQLADVAGAQMTVIACLSALWERERSGEGQHVDVSLLDSTLPLMTMPMALHWAMPEMASYEMPLSGGLAGYSRYRCRDDKYIVLGILEQKFWNRFCDIVDKVEWKPLLRAIGAQQEQLRRQLQELFASRDRSYWCELGTQHDICLSPVLAMPELEDDPHLQQRQMFLSLEHTLCGSIKSLGVPIKFSRTPASPATPPPEFGKDTQAVLHDAGFSKRQIEEWHEKKIVKFS